MKLNDAAALLGPEPLPLETGYERLPDGVPHVAVPTDVHGCSGEILLQYAYNEFTFLSGSLPSLYIAEHRDKIRPVVPR